jgi:glycosyltransferase involved in cell wall biosynthesis
VIESCLSQDYPNLDYLIVDDGSTDDTQEVLKKYQADSRVRTVRHEVNRGVTATKNTGLNNLSADTVYFGIIDSDDELLPGAISKLAGTFQGSEHPVSQVFGWCVDLHSREPTGQFPKRGGTVTFEDMLCHNFYGEFWQLVRADLLGGLRFEERASGGMSYLWLSLLRKAPALLIPDIVRLYDRSGQDRVSNRGYSLEGSHKTMWAYKATLDPFGAEWCEKCPERYAHTILELAKWACLAGERREAFRAIYKSLRAHPTSRAAAVTLMALLPRRVLQWAYKTRGTRRTVGGVAGDAHSV